MILTVGGTVGSGKSTLARALAEKLDLRYVSAGRVLRDMASEAGVSVLEYCRRAEQDPAIDKEVDARQVAEAKAGDCVVDGRLSAFFIDDADARIWLTAPLKVRVERVVGRGESGDVEAKILAREASERARYLKIYGINLEDESVYSLVLDNGALSIEETLNKVLEFLADKDLLTARA